MKKKYVISNNFLETTLLIGYIDDYSIFWDLMIIHFSQDNNASILISKSSLRKKEDVEELKNLLLDVGMTTLSSGSIDGTISALQERGYTEHEISKNLIEVWARLNSTSQQ